ncbi:protein of unknown function (plasmid) [Rhodovastum atsumiense]|nr:protein of unknown function [Rhodovastum atsumiense]
MAPAMPSLRTSPRWRRTPTGSRSKASRTNAWSQRSPPAAVPFSRCSATACPPPRQPPPPSWWTPIPGRLASTCCRRVPARRSAQILPLKPPTVSSRLGSGTPRPSPCRTCHLSTATRRWPCLFSNPRPNSKTPFIHEEKQDRLAAATGPSPRMRAVWQGVAAARTPARKARADGSARSPHGA